MWDLNGKGPTNYMQWLSFYFSNHPIVTKNYPVSGYRVQPLNYDLRGRLL